MNWQQHTVMCRNRDGRVADFIYTRLCPKNRQTIDGPFDVANLKSYYEGNIWCSDGVSGWGHANKAYWENEGWDLRPLEMHEEKPYPKAVLAYHADGDFYGWFLNEKYATGDPYSWDSPRPAQLDRDKGKLWCLNENIYSDHKMTYQGTWETQDQWENASEYGGWEFAWNEEGETEMKQQTTQELQTKLINYCFEKTSRKVHLEELQKIGALDPRISYEEVVDLINEYLDDTDSICDEGAEKARVGLGIKVQKFHVVAKVCQDIRDDISESTRVYYFVSISDTQLGPFDLSALNLFPMNAAVKVGYYE